MKFIFFQNIVHKNIQTILVYCFSQYQNNSCKIYSHYGLIHLIVIEETVQSLLKTDLGCK